MFIADEKHDNRTFVIQPKTIVIPVLKINKGDTEQFMEQMLVQSMLGYQLENMKKYLKPFTIPLKKFVNPKELSCLGFNLTNLLVKINKGFLQFNANYITVDEPVDKNICEKLAAAIRNNPTAMLDKLSTIPGVSAMKDKFGVGNNKQTEEVEVKNTEELRSDL